MEAIDTMLIFNIGKGAFTVAKSQGLGTIAKLQISELVKMEARS